jgi:hypothetical protein
MGVLEVVERTSNEIVTVRFFKKPIPPFSP